MADYRALLRVLENERPGRAVFFEYALNRELAEQLIWRRGTHLWETEAARVQTLADAAAAAGFDCAAAELAFSDGFPGLRGLQLAEGMKLAAGLSGSADPDMLEERYRVLAGEDAVCAVIVRNVPCGTPEKYRRFAGAVHRAGKPCIWADSSSQPIPLEELADCGFDGIHLTESYGVPMEVLLDRFGKRWALLGDTRFSWLVRQKPRDIIDYCQGLFQRTGGKGYAFGTGNPEGRPIPYLSYVAILSAYLRGREGTNSIT